MAFIDYYKVLGVGNNATQSEIKKAYHKLTKIYHPDKNENSAEANERYQEINEAYHVLNDPEKRKKYDEYGENWRHAEEFEAQRRQYSNGANGRGGYDFGGFGGFGGFGDFSGSAGNSSGFSDFFEQLFGSGLRGAKNNRGEDISATLTLSLREAAVTHQQTFTVGSEKIRITVPAGITDGQRIKLKGRGAASPDGTVRGDLYITFRIEPDSTFTLHGNDLYATVTVSLYTMLLGGEAVVPTLTGNAKVNIKAGTQPDSKLRLRGKGFPVYRQNGKYGDLIITVKVTLPQLNEKQKSIITELRQSS